MNILTHLFFINYFIKSFIRIKSRLKLCGEPLLSDQQVGE
jgi:hypothetical protein